MANRKSPRTEPEIRATAYHEAGHAAIHIALGLSVTRVSIIPNGDTHGRCVHPPPMGYPYYSQKELTGIARAMIVAGYAGMHAQRLVDPDAPDHHGHWDDCQAVEMSREYLVLPRSFCRVGDAAHLAYLRRLRKEAGRHVRRQRAAIERLAAALLERQELDGEEVEGIVDPLLAR